MVTDCKRNLVLSDIAGLTVGHRVLASCFYQLLDSGGIIYATATGIPVPSFPQWPAPTEIGGGVVIPCFYTLVVEDLDKTIEMLSATLLKMSEGRVMTFEIQD